MVNLWNWPESVGPTTRWSPSRQIPLHNKRISWVRHNVHARQQNRESKWNRGAWSKHFSTLTCTEYLPRQSPPLALCRSHQPVKMHTAVNHIKIIRRYLDCKLNIVHVCASWLLYLRLTWNSVSCCISSSCALLLLRGGMMLKKTFSKSRLSPDTLDRVKMGVMLPSRAQVCDQHKQTFYCYEF